MIDVYTQDLSKCTWSICAIINNEICVHKSVSLLTLIILITSKPTIYIFFLFGLWQQKSAIVSAFCKIKANYLKFSDNNVDVDTQYISSWFKKIKVIVHMLKLENDNVFVLHIKKEQAVHISIVWYNDKTNRVVGLDDQTKEGEYLWMWKTSASARVFYISQISLSLVCTSRTNTS